LKHALDGWYPVCPTGERNTLNKEKNTGGYSIISLRWEASIHTCLQKAAIYPKCIYLMVKRLMGWN
jgi:hypothetical protein